MYSGVIRERIEPTHSNDKVYFNTLSMTKAPHDSRLVYGYVRGFQPIDVSHPYQTKLTPQEIRENPYHTGEMRGYSEANTGSIRYYYSPDIAPAYYHPVYAFHTPVTQVNFVDPMGAVKPEYQRDLPYTRQNIIGDMFKQDSLHFRESLMALQQRPHNRVKYQAKF
jgi:hypothetical protein